MSIDTLEQLIGGLGAMAGLATLACAIAGMLWSLRQPGGREERSARFALRPAVLLAATLLFILAGILLWRPLPIQPHLWIRIIMLSAGALLFFSGLGLYLWGMRSLGRMFGPSSGFGVRLLARHSLITTGPYAHVRHPMYLAVITTAIGCFLLYRTWAALVFAIIMFGLVVRANREERVLALEFGPEWESYAAQVPAWLPTLGHGRRGVS